METAATSEMIINPFWVWVNSLDTLRDFVQESSNDPNRLIIYSLICFLVIGTILVIIGYVLSCIHAKKSELEGFFRVSVSMNASPDSVMSDSVMHFGTFLVGLYDAPEMTKFRLVPPRTLAEKASGRHYNVSALLHRFSCAFENAGMSSDQSSILLKTLLEDDNFCAELGNVNRSSPKRGLRYNGPSEYRRNPKQKDTVAVFQNIPRHIASAFATFPAQPEKIRIVLEYIGNDVK